MDLLSSLYRAAYERLRGRGLGLGVFNAVHGLLWERALKPEAVEFEGCRLRLAPTDSGLGDCLRMGRAWEPEVVAELKRMLRPGMTFADLGANIGYYAVPASRWVGPAGRVIAFEPDPGNLDILRHNLRENGCGNVTVHAVAVGGERGRADLHLCDVNPGAHSIEEVLEDSSRSVTVELASLDEYLDASSRPDVMKIDIEGAELRALKGMTKTLADPRLRAVFIECNPGILPKLGLTEDDVLAPLRAAGFAARRLDQDNVLCVRGA